MGHNCTYCYIHEYAFIRGLKVILLPIAGPTASRDPRGISAERGSPARNRNRKGDRPRRGAVHRSPRRAGPRAALPPLPPRPPRAGRPLGFTSPGGCPAPAPGKLELVIVRRREGSHSKSKRASDDPSREPAARGPARREIPQPSDPSGGPPSRREAAQRPPRLSPQSGAHPY